MSTFHNTDIPHDLIYHDLLFDRYFNDSTPEKSLINTYIKTLKQLSRLSTYEKYENSISYFLVHKNFMFGIKPIYHDICIVYIKDIVLGYRIKPVLQTHIPKTKTEEIYSVSFDEAYLLSRIFKSTRSYYINQKSKNFDNHNQFIDNYGFVKKFLPFLHV